MTACLSRRKLVITMTHKHSATGKEFEVGYLKDTDGIHTYDLTIITKWSDPESDTLPPVRLINYYFGGESAADNDCYIDKFVEQQQKLDWLVGYLNDRLMIDGQYMEPNAVARLEEAIETVQSMIDYDLV